MGRVYRAVQLATGQAVALKLLHPDVASDAQIVQRFQREAKLTTELSHPHIVKVIEFGESRNAPAVEGQVPIYIVGKTRSGALAGVMTAAVWT